jgi:adenylate cyclase
MKKILLSPWMAILTLVIVLSVRYFDPQFVEVIRLKYFDQLISSQPEKKIPVHVVNIDEATLEKYGQFPFPRDHYAKIIQDLYKRDAGLVVFGVMMPEADRFGKDGVLAATLEKYPVVLPQVAAMKGKNDTMGSPAQVVGQDPAGRIVEYPGVIANVPPLQELAAGVGIVNTFPEVDGSVRRLPLVIAGGDTVYPALALETLRVATGDTRVQVKIGEGGVEALRVPEFGRIDTDSLGRVWIDTANRPQSHSLSKLPESFDGGIVIVGLSAAGLQQPVATGVGEVWPQDLQAMLLGTMLNKTHIIRGEGADMYELAAIALVGVILLLLTRWMYIGIATLVVVTVGSVFASMYAYSGYYYLFDVTAFTVGIVLVALHAYVVKFLDEFFQKAQIKKQFGSYVNPVIVERLQQNPEFIKLGGEKRDLSIIMSDMRNFTGLGETYGDDVVAFTNTMNRYMTAIAEPILRNNGCLIKFIGDASLHVHGAPIQEKQDPDHVIAAVRTGLEMIHAVELFNQELDREGKPRVGMGLGINTGPTLIGNIGSKDRFGYDVLGDSVSLTARLEGQTKNYGQTIIISEFTNSRINDQFFTIELDQIAVKGKSVGVTIFTVFYNPDVTVAADWITAREHHDLMLSHYRRQEWDKAVELCGQLTGEFDGKMDEYYGIWQERIAEMRSRDLPKDWDGIFRAQTK